MNKEDVKKITNNFIDDYFSILEKEQHQFEDKIKWCDLSNQYKQALVDIKEYIEKDNNKPLPDFDYFAVYRTGKEKAYEHILDIVNKVLGDDDNG